MCVFSLEPAVVWLSKDGWSAHLTQVCCDFSPNKNWLIYKFSLKLVLKESYIVKSFGKTETKIVKIFGRLQ